MRSSWLSVPRRLVPVDEPIVRTPELGVIALFTALISLAELLLYYGHVEPAMWTHTVTLLLAVLLPLKLSDSTVILKAFVLLPLFRLVNLGMPIFFNVTLLWYPVIYGPLIPAGILIAQDLDVSLTSGWQYGILLAPLAIPVSAVLSAIEFSIITPQALITTDSILEVTLIALVMLLFIGFVEELLYRAILQRTLTDVIGFVPALLVANALFGLMHSAYGTPLEIVFAGVLGLVYGIVYRYTDSLLYITLLHGLLNTFLFGLHPLSTSVFGLPVAAEAIPLLP